MGTPSRLEMDKDWSTKTVSSNDETGFNPIIFEFKFPAPRIGKMEGVDALKK